MQMLMLVVSVGSLGYIFLNRDELTAGTLFGGVAVAAFVAGIMFTLAFKD